MLRCLLLLLAAPLPRSASADVPAVLAVLDQAPPGVDGDEALTRALTRLGPALLPDLFTVLAFGGGEERSLSAREEGALAAAITSFGSLSVRALVKARLSSEPASEERLAALRVLARTGSSTDLALVRRAVQGAGTGFEGALEEASGGILRRDARACEEVRRWMLEATDGIAAALARGIGASGAPQALTALAESLGYRKDLDPVLLDVIGPLAEGTPKPLDAALAAPLLEALEAEDPGVQRGAALALGHAQHAEAVPPLIQLLASEAHGVREAAEWALERITGLHFRADARRWTAWLRAERAWLEQEGPHLGAELRAGSPEIVIRALGELGNHPWRRHELALEAALALQHRSPLVRRLVCLTLARLGSTAAEAGLREALEDQDESVVEAAHLALVTLGLPAPGPSTGATRATNAAPAQETPEVGRGSGPGRP